MKFPSPGWLVLAVTVLAAAARFPAWAVITIGAAGTAGWYGYSLWRRPQRPCWWCRGRGETEGSDPERKKSLAPVGRCWVCKGRKSRVRLGVRVLMRRTAREIRAGNKGRNY